MKVSAALTDFYSLTMSQGYFLRNPEEEAAFEMFFRRQPFSGGFSVFAGLYPLLEELEALRFTGEDLAYLQGLSFFKKEFLDYLENFRFTGKILAVDEGTAVFPQEPLIRVEGRLIECQLIEGLLLNFINFQSLIATKSARVYLASKMGRVMEFGLRRAQGPDGAMSAARAAFIGGASGTSNVAAGREYGIPVMGTMAHSWVMAYPGEEEAFQAYADLYPQNPIFLIDTYDTLKSGLKNAVRVGRRLAEKGLSFGVRLDSGDIAYLSAAVRRVLDEAGLNKATITVSNDLDETIIDALTSENAPIDFWGVGTQLVTGARDAAFTGVYKLTARKDSGGRWVPAIKLSDNPEKTTTPAIKQVWRLHDRQGTALADVMSIDDAGQAGSAVPERIGQGSRTFWHPSGDYRHFTLDVDGSAAPLLSVKMKDGKITAPPPPLKEIQQNAMRSLGELDGSYKRLLNPHIYKVSVTEKLRELKLRLIKDYLGDL
jgi:nicotinate phosphoribosyltransferase